MKIFGIIIGGLIALFAFPFLALGIGIVGFVGDGTGIDIPLNGIDVPPKVIAVVSPEFSVSGDSLPSQVTDASVTFHVTPKPGGAPLFVGLAPSKDVKRYLKGATTAHLEQVGSTTGQSSSPGPNPQDVVAGDGMDVKLTVDPGRRKRVAPPATKGFWIRQADTATGDITVGLRDITGRNLRLVVMRIDGRPGIAVDASMRFRIPILKTVGWWLLGIGVVIALVGIGLIIWMIVLLGRPKKLPADASSVAVTCEPAAAEPVPAAPAPTEPVPPAPAPPDADRPAVDTAPTDDSAPPS